MIINVLYEIYKALLDSCHPSDYNNCICERVAGASKLSLDIVIPTYLCRLKGVIQVYKEVSVVCLMTYKLYDNPSFQCNLKVFAHGEELLWLTLKKSSVPFSGLGVFAARSFKKDEYITTYFGTYCDSSESPTYVFKKINGCSEIGCDKCLKEDYWFAHRIQHGSGKTTNVKITDNYLLVATKKITFGDELFIDYNRGFLCPGCKGEVGEEKTSSCDFSRHTCYAPQKCDECQRIVSVGRQCLFCSSFFICLQCYDLHQIK